MSMTHAELCERARRWLTSTARCPIVMVEFVTHLGEIPDAIGFRNGGRESIVIECKASRSDFLRDRHKRHRQPGRTALGAYRFFMCEPGVIDVADLPERWGLLLVTGRRVMLAAGMEPKRVYWPAETDVWRHEACAHDNVVMFSALRRLQIGLGLDRFRQEVQRTFSDRHKPQPASPPADWLAQLEIAP